MKEIYLTNSKDSEVQRLRDSRPVILLGSLISTYSRTSLPSGEEINWHVFTRLFPQVPGSKSRSWPTWLWDDYKSVPFEGIWACHPDPEAVLNAIVRLYSDLRAVANEFHEKMAEALGNGVLSGIITKNYDLAVERSKHAPAIRVIDCEGKLAEAVGRPPAGIYFKIHGSAKPELKDSIVYKLEQEGRLHKWKRELLATLLENRVLLVIGYSGRDFDICPEIASMKTLRGVYWLALPKCEVSPYVSQVLESTGGTLSRGEFCDLMSRLFGTGSAIKGKGLSLAEDLFKPEYFSLWRIRILERLRCYKLCRPLFDREPESGRKRLFDVYVNLLGHHGKYGQAARENLDKSDQYSRGSLEWISCRVAASASHLGQGKHILSIWQYHQARLALKRQMRGQWPDKEKQKVIVQVLRQKLTLAMRAGQLGILGSHVLSCWPLQKCLRRSYKLVLRLGPSAGTLDDLQWVQINAERLGFARDISQPLPSFQGLANLGLRGSALIPLRDKVRDGSWDITDEELRKIRPGLVTAIRYRLLHETWKFSWLLAWRGPKSQRTRHLGAWLYGFSGTEYGLPYRVLVLYRALGPRRGKRVYCLMRSFHGLLVWWRSRLRAWLLEPLISFRTPKRGRTTPT